MTAAIVWAMLGLALAHSAENPASCRIHNYLPNGAANVGSGTLIHVTEDGRCGLVLSCAHLLDDGAGRIVVEFPGGKTHGARVVAVDRRADLAALEIAKPQANPAAVSFDLEPSAPLTACGYGPSGAYRCVVGSVVGQAEGPGQVSLQMAGAVRSGDSGGGVFDARGRLVAVIWGESGGVTYASTGGPLRRFLDRVLGRRDAVVYTRPVQGPAVCPDGRCPLAGPGSLGGAPAGRSPAAREDVASGALDCGCEAQLAAIGARLDVLEQGAGAEDQSPAISGAGRAAGALAATALGISGPAGWGVIAAASIGSWLLGRRLKRRSSFRGQAKRTEQQQPIERDDREARELLRLSQLEGRDPLQDALAGRIALDRLDAAAEGDADPQHAHWADKLRRELRDRFNEIAPTKFQVTTQS